MHTPKPQAVDEEITPEKLKKLMKKKQHIAPMEKAEPVVAEEENKGNSMYDLEVDCARRKQAELLEMFPS